MVIHKKQVDFEKNSKLTLMNLFKLLPCLSHEILTLGNFEKLYSWHFCDRGVLTRIDIALVFAR